MNEGTFENQPNTDVEEGEIVTGRNLESYVGTLLINPEIFDGKRVLIVGAGSTNLEPQLNKRGIKPKLVANFDIVNHPFRAFQNKPIRTLIASFIDKNSNKPDKRELIDRIMGLTGRIMVRGDMKRLPFPDKSIDFALALWSTYQLNLNNRKEAFREMMRVADHIHVYPIYQPDIYMVVELIQDEFPDFDVVCSYPPPDTILNPSKFFIDSENDYQEHLKKEDRIYAPMIDKPKLKTLRFFNFVKKIFIGSGGYTLIITRKKQS